MTAAPSVITPKTTLPASSSLASTSGGAAAATAKLDTNTSAAQFSSDLNSFLKLFVTQLKNQDPLSPMDSGQFTQQIASMSQVEQSINSNKKLDTLISQGSAKDTSTLVSFLGKEVEFEGNDITLEAGKNISVAYNLDAANPPKQTFITVKKEDGTIVFNGVGTVKPGFNIVTWDGTDNSGAEAPAGPYQVFVTGTDGSGALTNITPQVSGKVTGIDLGSATPTVIVNGIELPLDKVKFLNEAAAIVPASTTTTSTL